MEDAINDAGERAALTVSALTVPKHPTIAELY